MTAPTFSSWLVGSGSLLTECGEVLLRNGHAVCGVVAREGRAADWARARGFPVVDPAGDWAAELARTPFDHLFAITHLARVPEAVLRLPRGLAINFHDGPLPDYAGLNAPAWALWNGEPRYGITWHQMEPSLDAGPILVQALFDLAPDETAFSLNAKCFEAALDTFTGLVRELGTGTLRPVPQDLRRRRTFERHRRPPAAGAIDWTRPAKELESMVRALDFGRYANPLGVPKLQRAGQVLSVTRAVALEAEADEAPSAPGTVLAVEAQSVLVATGRGALSLRAFADLAGRPVEIAQAARRLGLAPGAELERIDPESARRLTDLDQRMSRSERAWVDRLAALDPVALPFPPAAAPRSGDGSGEAAARAIAIAVPPALRERFPDQPPALVLAAALGAYCARLARRSELDLGYRDAAIGEAASGLEAFVEARLPLRVEVARGERFAALLERTAARVAELRARGPWLRDAAARYPELRGSAGEERRNLPVAVECVATLAEPALRDGAEWTLEVDEAGACRAVHDGRRLSDAHAESIAGGFAELLASLAADPDQPLAALAAVAPEERERQLDEWNATAVPHRRDACVHELFEEQAARTPHAVALVCEGRSLTYAELDARAELLAAELARIGVRPGRLVGIHLERSFDMVVAVLGILKAGGAYVPLDPAYPAERLAFLVQDAELGVIVTQSSLEDALPRNGARRVRIEDPPAAPANTVKRARATPADLAYVIYTSGSTGRPKGVRVEHRNVASFFAAIDERIPHDPPGTWLAVTSLSFDISVLELFWTLTRGFKVVLHAGLERERAGTPSSARSLDFSLFYFSSDEDEGRSDGYKLLLEGAKFADANGFRAVWTPERHFHAFGGLYPNPAVTGAAIAAVTRRVEIRAGSVVLPLHHPIRVAEEWALVDNLSGGRVGISFASGWHPDDFVLAPENRARAKEVMFRDVEVVRRLWRGEAVSFPGAEGEPVAVRARPRPLQRELPVWITSAGNVETYAAAGRIGANVLTHLVGQTIGELAKKIVAYREARAEAGFDPAAGVVTLMLHTFVGEDEADVRERVREPLERYLGSSLSLLQDHAWDFPAFKRPRDGSPAPEIDLAGLAPAERAALLAHARERYYQTSGLFGTPERCTERIEELERAGVDEVACLIDFGVPADDVLASLPLLDRVRREAQARRSPQAGAGDASIAALIRDESVTHLQCTPSMVRLLLADPAVAGELARVECFLVGGEALPGDLGRELAAAVGGSVTNLYGPTETTIWSSTQPVARGPLPVTVPIGRPIANTVLYVLDEGLQPLPIGAAGELFIGGDGVARGYLRRPELDAERFLADPFATGRMYRTGDLVRYRADGVLEFLGRTDHQIKVRGHRIEPGEIEAALLREPSVAEAVVVAREDTPGDQRLLAYVVARGAATDPAKLRARLKATLPESLVPAQVVLLDRMPRTPNGKTDRRSLPVPHAVAAPADRVPPASELEVRLSQLWQEVLGLERVGVEDNFFDLGGHSLLIVRIHRRIRELTSKRVSLTDLFRFPTVRSLALALASGEPEGGVDEAIRRGRRRRDSMVRRRRGVVGSPGIPS